jgi:BolA protein
MDRRLHIEQKLRSALSATHIEVVEESALHAGHAGASTGGGHFRALVVSDRFEGKNRLERQRLVYAALTDEMGAQIHALSMTTLTRSEWRR